MKEQFVVVIPARYASTRLPGKPLRKIAGLPMILHTVARAQQSGADRVYVATDDQRIGDVCNSAGVDVVMTRDDHQSGSDRLAEVCDEIQLDDSAIVVNVQGDEPLIAPVVIEQVASLLMGNADCEMASLYHLIDDQDDFLDPNVVKVVCDARERALYFSRAPIPFDRGQASGSAPLNEVLAFHLARRHIGLYAYRAGFLRRFVRFAPAPLERFEVLEQLRALHHGAHIMMAEAEADSGPGIDTEEDLQRIERLLGAAP
jgi:3-deoxy-manno-octulosonate cytidylyltransferase (CMP-KDO synthetase)